ALNSLPPTSACIHVTRSLAVDTTPPAAAAYEGFWLVSSLGSSVPALAAAWASAGYGWATRAKAGGPEREPGEERRRRVFEVATGSAVSFMPSGPNKRS